MAALGFKDKKKFNVWVSKVSWSSSTEVYWISGALVVLRSIRSRTAAATPSA